METYRIVTVKRGHVHNDFEVICYGDRLHIMAEIARCMEGEKIGTDHNEFGYNSLSDLQIQEIMYVGHDQHIEVKARFMNMEGKLMMFNEKDGTWEQVED